MTNRELVATWQKYRLDMQDGTVAIPLEDLLSDCRGELNGGVAFMSVYTGGYLFVLRVTDEMRVQALEANGTWSSIGALLPI